MAEILGIAAAVVQFVDIAVRVSMQLSGLHSDLRDVPDKLHRLKLEIDQQIAIAQYIKSSHATFQDDSPTIATATAPINQTLADYMLAMEELACLLQSIRSEDAAGPLRRRWDAVRAVHKRKDALVLCDRLQHQKSSVLLWLSNVNNELSVKIKTLLEGLQVDVHQTLQLTRKIEEASTKTDQQLREIPALTRLSNATSEAVSELATNVTSGQQQLLTATASTGAQVGTLLHQWHELAPTFQEFRDILQGNPDLLRSVYTLGISDGGNSLRNGYQSAVGRQPTRSRIHQDRLRGVTTSQETLRFSNACTCRDIIQATNTEPLSFLHFRKVFRRQHYRQCPKSKTSEISLEFLMKIIPPTWLLSHTIHLGFSLQSCNLQGFWKISPLVVGTARLVDSARSPAFRAIEQTWEIHMSEMGVRSSHITALERTLKDLFESHQASALDEDNNGNTLLYKVLKLYICQRPPQTEFLSLIRFLIDGGSNTNAHRRTEYSGGIVIVESGTVMDIFASHLLAVERNWLRGWPIDKLVYTSLVEAGAGFSRPLASCVTKGSCYKFRHFEQEMDELQTFEEQLDVCDMNDLMVSIIQRNEADFIRALGMHNVNEASLANGLTSVHLAIYWPWALQQIIRAGADINCEDNDHRRPIHLAVGCRQAEAAEILFQADCSVSTPDYSNSLLQESLTQGRDFDHVSNLVIDALIDRHTRLRDLALTLLPNNLGLEGNLRMKHSIPPALEVDRDEEGVYDTADMHGLIRLTVRLAEKLWKGGFRRFDDYAPLNGLTPLLQSWYIADFDMLSWFIEKGASPFSTHRDSLISGLHLYAARIAYPGAYFKHDPKNVPISPQHWDQLTQHGDSWFDTCRCPCSPDGCTPISIVIKNSFRFLRRERRNNYAGMVDLLRICQEKTLYQPETHSSHTRQILEAIVFEKLNLRHTCCHIGQVGQLEAWPQYTIEGDGISYGNVPNDQFPQIVEGYVAKMLGCQCPLAEKPACVVFRGTCGILS